jgi:carbamoyltransferase
MNVLGINFSNDSAAALVRDGHVIAASQEERFSRDKHDANFPYRAVSYCLKAGGITFDDVDDVAFFWNPGIHAETGYRGSGGRRHHLEFLYNVPNAILPRWFDGKAVEGVRQEFRLAGGKTLGIEYVTHHLAHVASAFYRSNYDAAAALIIDGYGERASATIARCEGTSLTPLRTVDFPHSLGSFYAAFTQFLGFKANSGEGKVMGLASYGRPSEYLELIRPLLQLTDDGFEIDLRYFSYFVERRRRYSDRLVALLGPERTPESPLTQRDYDIAFAMQQVTEDAMLHLARQAKALTGLDKLVMAGGVVLNCVANGRIQREVGFKECFFQPCAGDAGTSLGAALYVAHQKGAPRVSHPITDYLGPDYSRSAVQEELDRGRVPYVALTDVPAAAAKAIADGLIIGWFQGRAEFGPRALGNRSILCDPRRADMKDVLNARVKFREPFRPFAPSVLEEAATTYFDDDGVPSPFMLVVSNTRPEYADVLPSITHVDGGARVQTVNPSQNQRFYDLIRAVGEHTGISCVLNTSFNIRGEPIVHSPSDAMKCYFTTDMDLLFLGDFLVFKDAALAEKYRN